MELEQKTQRVLRTSPPDQFQEYWTCPKTGLIVPKTLADNLRWREKLRSLASSDQAYQVALRQACAASPIFWINAFCWTFRIKTVNNQGNEVPVESELAHHPFITWPVQDEFVQLLDDAIDKGEDVAIEKARDMGATWLGLAVIQHRWQFRRNQNFLELSRKEEYVDARGDMKSLFEKHRYLLKWQPSWLRPTRVRDTHMHLRNEDSGSEIVGESTNVHAGQGARMTAVFCDEWARVEAADEIALALADSTACRIYNSTHSGPGTHFHRIIMEGRLRVLRMPWWRHPEKSVGARQTLDPTGRIVWTSPWYERELERRSRKDVAQNLNMDPGQSGDLFFDQGELDRHRLDHVKPPIRRLKIGPVEQLTEDDYLRLVNERDVERLAAIEDMANGNWRIWCQLTDDGRPSQNMTYVAGIDISNGAGDSNSIITVVCRETGHMVAKFWDSYISPEELATAAMLAGIWFGGLHNPMYLCWENNGPGAIFGRKVVKWKYPHYYVQRRQGSLREKRTDKYGWHSNKENKEVLLARYREAIAKDKIVIPCAESLDEAGDYIYDKNGLLVPSQMRQEEAGGQELHGDHVVADALAFMAVEELPRARARKEAAPVGSFIYRRKVLEKKKRRDDPWS